MKSTLEKSHATAIVLVIVLCITGMVVMGKASGNDVVVTGLLQLASAVLAAGAVAHGVVQGKKRAEAADGESDAGEVVVSGTVHVDAEEPDAEEPKP